MDIQDERRRLLDAEESEDNQEVADTRSVQDAYLDKVRNGNLYLAVFVSVLGPLSFGFVLGYSSPAIPDLTSTTDDRVRLDNDQASWFGLSLMLSALPFVFGFTIIAAAQNIWMLYVGRALTGLASGIASLVVPVYISEMAHERVRGTVGSCVQLMVVTGICGAYWRWLAVCGSVPPTLLIVGMCFMPETPRYLLSHGKRREAEAALRFLRGPDAPVEWECARIQEACGQQESAGFRASYLREPGVYKPLAIGMLLMFFQQATGINAIMFYAENIFKDAQFEMVFTGIAAVIMDRAGRRVLLCISGVAMAISAAVFGVFFFLTTAPNNTTVNAVVSELQGSLGLEGSVGVRPQDLAALALASMAVFIAGFALGWGPIPWLVMSEIFPSKVRGFASAACVLTNWGNAFIITKFFQNLLDWLGSAGTFWLFASMCAVNVVFTMAFVPETKGKSLEEIQEHFSGARA
ncbi:hypothetical protein CRUP_001656, partial [Coryphaenoides rupestris]